MSETGGESYTPGEGASGAPEQLSEEARQRFAAAAAAMQAIQREEKKSKKRDGRVARTILQFLQDERYTHLFVLISRLVARDCPSIFILAILSLINDECLAVTQEYLNETGSANARETSEAGLQLLQGGELNALANQTLVEWITRLQLVLSTEAKPILDKLMIDDRNIDGTVLQLSTFVLQEFFRSEVGGKRNISFENLHALTSNILQTVFEPFMQMFERKNLPKTQVDDD